MLQVLLVFLLQIASLVNGQMQRCFSSDVCPAGQVCNRGYCMKVYCYGDYQCPKGNDYLKCIQGLCSKVNAYAAYSNYSSLIRNTRQSGVTCTDGKQSTRSCSLGCFLGQSCYQGMCCNSSSAPPKPSPSPASVCGKNGRPLMTNTFFGGGTRLTPCGPNVRCSSKSVCNPKTSYCCTSLSICKKSSPLLDNTTNKPKSCHGIPNPQLACGQDYECQSTGFCCKKPVVNKIPDGRINGKCLISGQCFGVGSECRLGTCKCRAGTHSNGVDCIRENNTVSGMTHSECSGNQCFSTNTECHLNKCVCRPGTSFNGIDCIVDSQVAIVLPKPGEPCDRELLSQCESLNSFCDCSNPRHCICRCISELGYLQQGDSCVRARRKLAESCGDSSHCSTAYSHCASTRFGKKSCLCREGFSQRPGEEACIPNEFSCGRDNEGPLMVGGRLVECDLSKKRKSPGNVLFSPSKPQKSSNAMSYLNVMTGMVNPDLMLQIKHLNDASVTDDNLAESKACRDPRQQFIDSCPSTHYCVPSHDDPLQTEHFTGFCCRKPKLSPPKCPVGKPHPTSFAPNYGCGKCPLTHYCHQDPYTTELSVCCPRPCINPDDIFENGQCLPATGDNEQCEVDVQCDIGARLKQMKRSAAVTRNDKQQRILVKDVLMNDDPKRIAVGCKRRLDGSRKCGCERGYVEIQGSCQRARCTVGFGSEPLGSTDGSTRRCIPQSQQASATILSTPTEMHCPSPYICDPEFAVCCKSYTQLMCPPTYVEEPGSVQCRTNLDCGIVSGHVCVNSKCCRKQ